jgi:hypothetical protein
MRSSRGPQQGASDQRRGGIMAGAWAVWSSSATTGNRTSACGLDLKPSAPWVGAPPAAGRDTDPLTDLQSSPGAWRSSIRRGLMHFVPGDRVSSANVADSRSNDPPLSRPAGRSMHRRRHSARETAMNQIRSSVYSRPLPGAFTSAPSQNSPWQWRHCRGQ